MPCVAGHAMNTNDVMCESCAMCALASWPSLGFYDTPEITYWHTIHAS